LNLSNDKQKGLLTTYSDRLIRFGDQLIRQKKKLNRVAWSRFFVFILIVLCVYLGFKFDSYLFFSGAFFLLVSFFWLVKTSARILREKDHLMALIELNQNELLALEGDFRGFANGIEFLDREHPYMFDLDLFGDQSLFQFLNRSYTQRGKDKLASYLVSLLKNGNAIRERQIAVQDLSGRLDWRQHFQATAMNLKQDPLSEARLLEWLNDTKANIVPRIFKLLAIILPISSFGLILLSLPGWIPWQIPVYFLLIPLAVVGSLLKRTQKFSLKMASALKTLKNNGDLIQQIEQASFNAPLLVKSQKKLNDANGSAGDSIKSLGKILDAFDSRNNIFVGVVLNALLLWDIHCLTRFEKWKKMSGTQVKVWLEILGQLDALSSLGTLHFNHPDYTFPTISEHHSWEFLSVGHPLIPEKSRVDNDLKIEKEGNIIIVTGPNMAGKSTFLRAIGVNLVLAMAGAPVCARKMMFFPNRLFTSMRTTDSLQKSESYFYSELKRLQVLLSVVKDASVFLLLDEILKGTNSKDKSSGSAAVIKKLILLNGTGLIATHDLSLGVLEKSFPEHVFNKCFEAEIRNNDLHFDFKLKGGITHNMNATFLMKKMGIIG